jgi:hypothetical protein
MRLTEHGEQQMVGSDVLFLPLSALGGCQVHDSSLTGRQLERDLRRLRESLRPQLLLELTTKRTQINASVLEGCDCRILRLTKEPERDVARRHVVITSGRSDRARNGQGNPRARRQWKLNGVRHCG